MKRASKDFWATRPVMGLLKRLTTFRVDWSKTGGSPRDVIDYEVGIDREEADLDKANVVSSKLRPQPWEVVTDPGHHVLAIDLDVPAYLVPSSTEGHSHLYVDVKIPHHRYLALLSALADAGVIEKGYAQVSIARGHSDLRLPWVHKGDAAPAKVEAPPAVPTEDLGGLFL